MIPKFYNLVKEYLLTPIISGLKGFIGVFIISSMFLGPLALYLGASDGLWNYQRSVSVAIGLPFLTLIIFNFINVNRSSIVKKWHNYIGVNLNLK